MKKLFLLLLALIATTSVLAEDYITDIMVIGGSKSETNALKASYTEQGWTVIDQDLNAGAGGDYIFLLYKKASEVNATYGTFIKDIYISSDSGTAPDYIVHNLRPYELAPYDGSDYFKSSKGDLNCHCSGSDYIHLYYTIRYPSEDNGRDYTTVKSIYFNSTQAGAVGENGGTTGYDLNAGAGGDYIYMHTEKSQGWTFTKNSDGTQCYINGFDGPETTLSFVRIPTTLDGAQVANFVDPVFSGFTNLEEIIFFENTIVSQMPLMQGCPKFKHVRTGNNFDQTPLSMTNIPASAFAGTAIQAINMPSVTNIGEHAFEGSGLKQATLHSCLMEIGSYAFQNCNSLTDIYFDGTQQQWFNVTKGANWKPNATKEHWRCTVTFDVNGHGNAPEAQTIWSNQGKATEPAAPTDELCIFQGWYTDATCTNQWDFNTVVTGDMTLYAKWYVKYTFNSSTGALTLNWGEYNKYDKWGNDVLAESVTSVTATSDVSFTGDCSQLFQNFSNCTSMDLSKVNTSNAINMGFMFENCNNLTSLDISGWNTGKVFDMGNMFSGCSNLTSLDLSKWNTSRITDIRDMFSGCSNLTSLDLSGWDTGKVLDMGNMFFGCSNLTSLDLSGWNTINATNMGSMFENCNSLTSLDLSKWNTGRVTDMSNMFNGCTSLTSIYASSRWSTEKVTSSNEMFKNCVALVGGMGTTYNGNHIDKEYARIDKGASEPGYFSRVARYTYDSETGELSLNWGEFNKDNKWGDDVPTWNVKSVVASSEVSFTGDCSFLFRAFGCERMDLSNVNTSDVTNMNNMFLSCALLTSLDISGWDTEHVTDMNRMFFDCWKLPSLNLSGWNTRNVTNMDYMFCNCKNLNTIYVGPEWNTENVVNSYGMFDDCTSLVGGMGTTFDANHIDKEYARIDGGPECPGYFTMGSRYIFNSEAGELKLIWGEFNNGDVWGSDVDPSAVKSVSATSHVSFTGNCLQMFLNFSNCESMDLSKVNTGNATNMSFMFHNCNSLTSLDLSNWDTGNVTNMRGMFANCTHLPMLDISSFNTGNITDMSYMFSGCEYLTTIYAGAMWSTENVTNSDYMFNVCRSLVGGMGTTYSYSHIDKEYARIDGGPECPGYFTAAPQGVPGDVNGDGAVTSVDVTCVYNYLLNGDESYIDTCDVNGDGYITSTDITVIYNLLLGN